MGIQERKERERLEKRQRIVDSAKRDFLEFGLEKTTMDSIALRAEISKGSIYLHFKDKEALILAILEDSFQALTAAILKEGSEAEAGLDRLLAMFRGYREFCKAHPDHFFFTHFADHLLGGMKEVPKCNPFFSTLSTMIQQIEENIAIGQKMGALRPELEPKKTSVIIVQLISSFFQRISKAGDLLESFHGFPKEDLIRSTFEFILFSIQNPKGDV